MEAVIMVFLKVCVALTFIACYVGIPCCIIALFIKVWRVWHGKE